MSEDDRDAEIQRELMEKKRVQRGKKGMRKRVGSMFAGQEIYLAMVKKTQNSMKELTMAKSDKAQTPALQNTSSVADKKKAKTKAQKAQLKNHNDKTPIIKHQPSQTSLKDRTKHRGGGKKKRVLKDEHPEQIFEGKKKERDEDDHKDESSSDNSQTHSEENADDRIIRKRNEREEKKKKEETRIRGIIDMSNDEVEERKK